MLSWLFGEKKKKRARSKPRGKRSGRTARSDRASPGKTEGGPESRRVTREQTADSLGGPEEIAKIIRSLLLEDKARH